jgi:uncharacterized protein
MPNRLAPDLPFPPYSYVTGRFPHPTRDPLGHSFAQPHPSVPPLNPQYWQASQEYLHAIDLFNHGYYWEAHEAWEELWHAAGRRGVIADYLKALIKFAAAGVKVREGRIPGVRRHAQRAIELFRIVQAEIANPDFCGFVIEKLIAIAQRIAASPPASTQTTAPVEIVFDFQLEPQSTTSQTGETDPQ